MEKVLKFIWLTQTGITPPKIRLLFEYFGTIDNIYLSKNYDIFSKFSQRDKDLLIDKSLDNAKEIYRKCQRCGARVLTYDDDMYPEALRNISSPPYVLYVKGQNINLNDEFCIGVVGTRYSTSYGGNITSKFCTQMAQKGIVIVSGMARGIDSVAAYSALKARGLTVAVLGCGIDIAYPVANKRLYQSIERYGLIISEYPPGMPAAVWTFPRRNRIIAGLSRGVIVVEGSKKSGSMITARFAEEFSRDLFAVPRSIDGSGLDGTNMLIKEGAIPMTCIEDLIEQYPELKYKTPMKTDNILPDEDIAQIDYSTIQPKEEQKNIQNTDENSVHNSKDINSVIEKAKTDIEKDIIKFISYEIKHIDNIADGLNMGLAELSTKLCMLEMSGLIEQLPGRCYRIKD